MNTTKQKKLNVPKLKLPRKKSTAVFLSSPRGNDKIEAPHLAPGRYQPNYSIIWKNSNVYCDFNSPRYKDQILNKCS